MAKRVAQLSFWFGVVLGAVGLIADFYPGMELRWFVAAGVLTAAGAFAPRKSYRVAAVAACVVWSIFACVGYQRGREYEQWLQTHRSRLMPGNMVAEFEKYQRKQNLLGTAVELSGTTVKGTTFEWKSYRGRVVLIDFWFTSCGPCLQKMPHLVDLYARYHDAGFDVVGISTDAELNLLNEYLALENIPWETIHEPWGSMESNVSRYNITEFPTSFLVDKSGKLVSVDSNIDKIEQLIQEHLSET